MQVLDDLLHQIAPEGDARTPPKSIELEQRLLGGLMLNNAKLDEIADFLKAEHFSEEAHAKIYHTLCAYRKRGRSMPLRCVPISKMRTYWPLQDTDSI